MLFRSVLVTYVLSQDDRLPRKALTLFRDSLQAHGLTRSNYPGRSYQVIPPFSLLWIAMLHDFARWRDEAALVKELLPAARSILEAWNGFRNGEGLIERPRGWNFVDWVPAWESGIPPHGRDGVSAVLNFQYLLALGWGAELEEAFGEPELAALARRRRTELLALVRGTFWDAAQGCFADTRDFDAYSEHANCLAILTGLLTADESAAIAATLRGRADLARATIYFSHYLFETYARLDMQDLFFERMEEWFILRGQGLYTKIGRAHV